MSSEAAYFPGALANAPEAGSTAASALEMPASTQSKVSEVLVRTAEAADDHLMEQVRDGSKDALALLFRRHARSVRNVAYRILRDEAEADDLVQDVFLFLFRKAALFNAKQGAARSWIFQVTYHRAFDRRRYLSTRHFYTNQDLDHTARHLADPRDELRFHELSMEGIFGKQLTARFNARLTPEQRETIQLFFFEGYALKEIAKLTGRSLVNVRSHYYRGLERLREYVLPEKVRSK
jgi:RNA polymerase sigma-70 factor (ECF subfamily)